MLTEEMFPFSLSLTFSLFVKLYPRTLFHITVSAMTTNCTNLATFLTELIHSTQSFIFDVKAWMTVIINNKMQLYNNQTKMIPIATKTVLNSVPQFIKLEVSDVKLANTVRILSGTSSDCATICPKSSPKIYCVHLFFQD